MSLRQFSRAFLHLWLAISVAMPAAAWVTPTQALDRLAVAASKADSKADSKAVSIASSTEVSAGEVERIPAEHARGSSCHEAAQAKPAPLAKHAQPSGPPADHADDHSDAAHHGDCCDGGCDGHSCDRASCLHLAWLPRMGSSATPVAQSLVFSPKTSSPARRLSETPLRPPIASRR